MDKQSYYENLIKVVIEASVADTWESAVLEWEIIDCTEDESAESQCVCKHEGLKYLYKIRNYKNGNKLFPIGSTCIKKFGREDLDEEMRVFINPQEYTAIRKGAEFEPSTNVQGAIGGSIGYIYNAAVVVSNRVPQGKAYIVKPGALGIELKRDTNVESDRDILAKVNVYAVDKHYAAYLRDKTKVVKIANE